MSGANNINSAAGLTLAPYTTGNSVSVYGTGSTVNYTSGLLADTTAASYTFGSTSDSNTMTVASNAWTTPVTFLNGSGKIEFGGAQADVANSLTAVSNSGNIQLDSGATITSTASSGNSIVLAAGGNFSNSAGSSALAPGSGTARWIVYSTGNGDTKGGLSESQDVYGQTYGTEAPASVPGSGNTWVYNDGLLTVTASTQTITYGSSPNLTATSGSTYSYSCNPTCGSNPVTGGPTISVSGVATSATSGKDNAGTWNNAISVSGATAAGYIIAYVTGNLIVNPMAITVTAATDTKTYDATTSATAAMPTVTSGSIVTGDTGNFTETYANKNAGTGKTLTPAGSVSDGNSGNNYSITFTNNTTGVINAANITVTGLTAGSQIYNATTVANLGGSASVTPLLTTAYRSPAVQLEQWRAKTSEPKLSPCQASASPVPMPATTPWSSRPASLQPSPKPTSPCRD